MVRNNECGIVERIEKSKVFTLHEQMMRQSPFSLFSMIGSNKYIPNCGESAPNQKQEIDDMDVISPRPR